MEKLKATKKVSPDGGVAAWSACFGVSLVNLATRSIEPSFGLLFGDMLKTLNVSTTGASVIISLLDIMMNFSGLFVGPLLKEFSYRKVAIFGSLLCGIGLAATSPASSIAHILITYSMINGIGVGLATSAAFVALNHYFSKKRGQAVGLSMAGTALGMLIMPQLVRILLEEYGFQGAVLLLSGLALHSLVGSTLLQPIKWHLKEEEIDVEMIECEYPALDAIIEDEGDEDSLPEIQSLLFKNNKNESHREKKISESSNTGVSINGSIPGNLPKRPTFPRITSTNSIPSTLPKRPTFPRITSTVDMTPIIRKRRVSVISQLSQLDFSGSNLHIHLDTGDKENEESDFQFIRRVNTHMGNSLYRESLGSIKPGKQVKKLSCPDFIKSEFGIEMSLPPKASFWQRFANLMDVGLLKDVVYLNILFGLSIFYVAEMNFKMVTPFFLANLGYTKADIAFCLSVSALTDILARVVVPPICDKTKVSKRLVFMISVLFVATTRSILAEQTEWTNLMVWLSICGFFRGIALSNFTLTVSEYSSLEKLPAAFGWHMVGKGIFVVCFGPLIGAIRDWTDSFPICIHAQSVCILLCILAWSIEFIIKRFDRDDSQPETVSTITA